MVRSGFLLLVSALVLLPAISRAASPVTAVDWHAYMMAIRQQRNAAIAERGDLQAELAISVQSAKKAAEAREADWHNWLQMWCGGWPGRCAGPAQDRITISTSPSGARCVISRDGKEIAKIAQTPADVAVDKGKETLTVSCEAAGYTSAAMKQSPTPEGYPPHIEVKLTPAGNPEAVHGAAKAAPAIAGPSGMVR